MKEKMDGFGKVSPPGMGASSSHIPRHGGKKWGFLTTVSLLANQNFCAKKPFRRCVSKMDPIFYPF